MLSQAHRGVIAALLCLAAWLAWMDVTSFQRQAHYQVPISADKSSNSKTINVTPEERLAEYTGWLAVLTVALVLASVVQGFFLLRADKTARITALAAKRSADAAIGVELPILVPVDIALLRDLGGGVQNYVVGYPDTASIFRLRLRNLGRTAAELTSQGVEWRVLKQLPKIPIYTSNFAFTRGSFCEPTQPSPMQILRFPINLQPDEVRDISENTKFLWLYGRIIFKDFLGEQHEQRWCAKWQGYAPQPDGALAAIGFVYDSTTPAEYAKRT
jgi:hypothetical protein